MRILQLANFYSAQSGGLRTALRALARHYAAAGHEVVRVVPGDRPHLSRDESADVIEVRSVAIGRTGYRLAVPDKALITMVRELRPDSIELSDKLTFVRVAAALRGDGHRVVLLSHERLDTVLRTRTPAALPHVSLANARNRALARHVDTVVCASSYAANEWVRIGMPNWRRVPLGVDLEAFTPSDEDRRGLGGLTRLVFVGRLSREKAPQVAVDTARILGERGVQCHLDMVGTGPLQSEIEHRARGLSVTFHGHVGTRDRVASLIRSAHVALAPCPVETFGLAALEALACGTPVVLAASGALPELFAPGATLVTRSDARDFAAAVMELRRTDPRLVALLARAHAERFPWSNTADVMLSIHAGESRTAPMVAR